VAAIFVCVWMVFKCNVVFWVVGSAIGKRDIGVELVCVAELMSVAELISNVRGTKHALYTYKIRPRE
jgi:hypothetical protein